MSHAKTYPEVLRESCRLAILRVLADTPGYSANLEILRLRLPAMGHTVSHDGLRTNLAWLEEQALVRLVDAPPLLVATLLDRGLDVSQGVATTPGVARPLPGSA